MSISTKLPNKTILCGIGYRISEHEDLIVFSEDICFWGTHTRMAFTKDKYSSWEIEISTTWNKIPACHIVASFDFLQQHKGNDFGREYNSKLNRK